MHKSLLLAFLLALGISISAQHGEAVDTSWKNVYRETATRINNLVHTRLELVPDFSKSYCYGKAWITLKPHFYSTDSLTLDAKGMDIKSVNLVKGTRQTPLKFTYDELQLRIRLDKTYTASES
jgi:aminopeptidase N